MFSWIINLFAEVHACPQFLSLAAAPCLAVLSKSVSSKTMKASFPPNSNNDFLIFAPARDAIFLPVASLPVRLTPFTNGFVISSSISAYEYSIFCKIPSGKPDFLNSSSMALPEPLQIDACFRRTTFPAKIVGTAKRSACQKGKFHGIIPRITPIGW